MSNLIEIMYLKRKLKNNDITENEKNSIREEIKGLEIIEQKNAFRILCRRKYKNMIRENNNYIDKERDFRTIKLVTKYSRERLDEILLGMFGDTAKNELEKVENEIYLLKDRLKYFEKTIDKKN